jgi:DNA replication protein DnaC
MAVAGWQVRFEAAVVEGAAMAAKVAGALNYRKVLGTGLSALAEFTVDEMAAFIKEPRLADLARQHDAQIHGGRLVLGPTGAGKSTAGACLVRRRCESDCAAGHRDLRVRWVRAIDLPNARLEHSLGKGEAPLITEAIKAEFLIVDDVGWESKRAGADDVVCELFARRYDAGKQSYVTSGLTYEQFRERYSDAIVRRITESGGKPGKVINLWGNAAK